MPKAVSTIDHLPRLHIKAGQIFCSTHDLASYVDKPHAYVCRAVKIAIKAQDEAIEYARTAGRSVPEGGLFKFEQTPFRDEQNGETYDAYDLDRNATVALIMGFRGAKATLWKMGYIAAFNRMEEELQRLQSAPRTDLVDLTNLASVQAALLTVVGRTMQLEARVAEQRETLAVVEPKAAAWDAYKSADGLIALSDVGRVLGTGPNKTIDWMIAQGLLFKTGRGSPLRPMERYRRKGWFDTKTRTIDDVERIQTFVTPRGLAEIAELIGQPTDLFGKIDRTRPPQLRIAH